MSGGKSERRDRDLCTHLVVTRKYTNKKVTFNKEKGPREKERRKEHRKTSSKGKQEFNFHLADTFTPFGSFSLSSHFLSRLLQYCF